MQGEQTTPGAAGTRRLRRARWRRPRRDISHCALPSQIARPNRAARLSRRAYRPTHPGDLLPHSSWSAGRRNHRNRHRRPLSLRCGPVQAARHHPVFGVLERDGGRRARTVLHALFAERSRPVGDDRCRRAGAARRSDGTTVCPVRRPQRRHGRHARPDAMVRATATVRQPWGRSRTRSATGFATRSARGSTRPSAPRSCAGSCGRAAGPRCEHWSACRPSALPWPRWHWPRVARRPRPRRIPASTWEARSRPSTPPMTPARSTAAPPTRVPPCPRFRAHRAGPRTRPADAAGRSSGSRRCRQGARGRWPPHWQPKGPASSCSRWAA